MSAGLPAFLSRGRMTKWRFRSRFAAKIRSRCREGGHVVDGIFVAKMCGELWGPGAWKKRSALCQWSCVLVDHFLEVKLLEQVNFHFRFFIFRHIVGSICCCVILTFGSYIFGSFFATLIGGSICCFVRVAYSP